MKEELQRLIAKKIAEAYEVYCKSFPADLQTACPTLDQFTHIINHMHARGMTPDECTRFLARAREAVVGLDKDPSTTHEDSVLVATKLFNELTQPE